MIGRPKAKIDIAYNHTKFGDASFSRSEDISEGVKF